MEKTEVETTGEEWETSRASVGADRPTLMRQVTDFSRRKPKTERKKTMDDWILDSDWEPETVEFSEDELETLEMAIEFFLDGYCDGEE